VIQYTHQTYRIGVLSIHTLMGVGSGGQGGTVPPWIFIHGTDIIDRAIFRSFLVLFFGLFLLFFGVFSVASSWKRRLVLFFVIFLLFFILFPLPPLPENFSADALAYTHTNLQTHTTHHMSTFLVLFLE